MWSNWFNSIVRVQLWAGSKNWTEFSRLSRAFHSRLSCSQNGRTMAEEDHRVEKDARIQRKQHTGAFWDQSGEWANSEWIHTCLLRLLSVLIGNENILSGHRQPYNNFMCNMCVYIYNLTRTRHLGILTTPARKAKPYNRSNPFLRKLCKSQLTDPLNPYIP